MEMVSIKTNKKMQIIDITEQIKNKINIKDGLVHIRSLHTTAGVFINEGYDENLKDDFINHFKNLPSINFKHAEGNSRAHIFSTLVGNECNIPINNYNLELGTWQKVLFFEFDGPRNRKVSLKEISD